MKALEIFKQALEKCLIHEKIAQEAIIKLNKLQEELRILNEEYASLLKQYHELKDKK